MPQLTAATCAVSGSVLIAPDFSSPSIASRSATQPPVIAAQRVPPSACSTSQSTVICRSPSATRSMPARKLRPISRWISWVRPDCLPAAASRRVRVVVERGSMPYSAVTQPSPVLRRNGGTVSSTLAVQSTWVSPMRIRQEPSAWRVTPVSMLTGRSASVARPDGRMGGLLRILKAAS